MNQLQKNFSKQIKRNKKKTLLREKGKLYGMDKRTGRLKVRQRNRKTLLNKICEEILKQKEEVTTSDIQIIKSPTDV